VGIASQLYKNHQVTLEEKPHFLTCLRRLKVSFMTIFDKKIVAKNTFSHLRQIKKWGFSTAVNMQVMLTHFVSYDI